MCKMVVMSFDMLALADSCLCIRVYSTIMIRKRTTENFVCKSNFREMQKRLRERARLSSFLMHCVSSLSSGKKNAKMINMILFSHFFRLIVPVEQRFFSLALTRNSFN